MDSPRRDVELIGTPNTENLQPATRKPYQAPTLIAHGRVADVTRKIHVGPDGTKSISDRSLKEGFAPVDSSDVLARIAALPIESWSYAGGDGAVHIGPMAQDFAAAFGVGEDNRRIDAVDAAGVSLAAIKGLLTMVEERDARVRTLQIQVEALSARLEALENAQAVKTEAAAGR